MNLGDQEWYELRDGRKNLPARCPIAANDKCPRYYLSQKHAAKVGVQYQDLSDEARERIEKIWEASDVFSSWDFTPGVSLDKNDSLKGVINFCPEVTARIFDHYCSSIQKFTDAESMQARRKSLKQSGVPDSDPRQNWMVFEPRRYTECREFSIYGQIAKGSSKNKRKLSSKLRFAVLERDDFRCFYCGKTGEETKLHVDHKISVANGGDDSLENLITACAECNLGKGSRSYREKG